MAPMLPPMGKRLGKSLPPVLSAERRSQPSRILRQLAVSPIKDLTEKIERRENLESSNQRWL
jgi:hypothetical protein